MTMSDRSAAVHNLEKALIAERFLSFVTSIPIDEVRQEFQREDSDLPELLEKKGSNSAKALEMVSTRFKLPVLPLSEAAPANHLLETFRLFVQKFQIVEPQDLPWVPISVMGHCFVIGHFFPDTDEMFGLDDRIVVKVVLDYDEYLDAYREFRANIEALFQAPNGHPKITLSEALDALPEDSLLPGGNRTRDNVVEEEVFSESDLLLLKLKEVGYLDLFREFEGFSEIHQAEKVLAQFSAVKLAMRAVLEALPVIPLSCITIDHEVFDLLPESFIENFGCIAYANVGETLFVAVPHGIDIPNAFRIRSEIMTKIRHSAITKVMMVYTPADEIQRKIEFRNDDIAAVEARTQKRNNQTRDEDADLVIDQKEMARIRKVDRTLDSQTLLKWLFYRAIIANASDIHIEENDGLCWTRIRINGYLKEILATDGEMVSVLISQIKVLADMDAADRRLPQDGRLTVVMGSRVVDARISTVPVRSRESCVIRLISKNLRFISISDLGLPVDQERKLKWAATKDSGLILITGPTGSGKTSTLYSLLSDLKSVDTAIITIEDPVEIELPGTKQIQVNSEIGLSFASSLRAVLRHDPDVIMVGEIRDSETAELAMQAASTGHLVLSTLHTNDALRSVSRLFDLGCDPGTLANNLLCLQAQRLIRVLCPACKKQAEMSKETLLLIEDALKQLQITQASSNADIIQLFTNALNGDVEVFHPHGCEQCRKTGFVSRKAIMEVCPMSNEIRDQIYTRAPYVQLLEEAQKSGFRTLFQEGIREYLMGRTSLNEVQGHATSYIEY